MDNSGILNTDNSVTLVPTFREYIHPDRFRWLIDHLDDEGLQFFKESDEAKGYIRGFYSYYQKNHFRGWYDVRYERPTGIKRGRYYAKPFGLQFMDRLGRHTVCQGFYADADMVNCHPNIYYQIAAHEGWPYARLLDFVQNRDERVQEFCQLNTNRFEWTIKKTGKKHIMNPEDFFKQKVILALMNGGDYYYNMVQNKPAWLIMLRKELDVLRGLVVKEYPALYEWCKKKQDEEGKTNYSGSTVSYLLQSYEDDLLESMKKFFTEKGIRVTTLCNDGCQLWFDLKCQGLLTPQLLQECEERMQQDTDFVMKIKIKPFNQGLQLPDELLKLNPDDFPCVDAPVPKIKVSIKMIDLPKMYTDHDLGNYIFKHFDSTKIISVIRKGGVIWFLFDQHRWKEVTDRDIIKLTINDFLIPKYEEWHKRLLEVESAKKEEDKKKKDPNSDLALINRLLLSIKQETHKRSIVSALATLAKNDSFMDKLDQNPYLTGFNNGVYDTIKKEFRDGKASDYVTKTCGYDFIISPESPESLEILKKIDKFFDEISCGRPDLKEALYDLLSRHTVGDNVTANQLFYFFVGKGSNGKNALLNFLQALMGEYFTTIPTSFLTQNEARSDAPNPDTKRLIGTRFALSSETDENMKFNTATIRRVSGDKITSWRAFHDDKIRETNRTWVHLHLCNEKPKLPMDCGAVMRRIIIIPFDAHFVDKPDPTKKEDYKLDMTVEPSFPQWAPHLMSFLLKRLDVTKRIVFPDWIYEQTKKTISETDMLLSILDTLFEPADPKYGISWADMKERLSSTRKMPEYVNKTEKDFKEMVCKRLNYSTLITNLKATYTCTSNVFSGEQSKRSMNVFMNIRFKRNTTEIVDDKGEVTEIVE